MCDRLHSANGARQILRDDIHEQRIRIVSAIDAQSVSQANIRRRFVRSLGADLASNGLL